MKFVANRALRPRKQAQSRRRFRVSSSALVGFRIARNPGTGERRNAVGCDRKVGREALAGVITRRNDNVRIIPVRRIGTERKRVNVDFPGRMVDSLDREARRLGVTRQSLIKLWLADRLGQKAV